ncbi:hypothetical protein LCGC14_2508020 [marine sediment metagenome]|uniref:Uncharacterized protein n=1 Tax=marine sediment metagenome TaxID=412755 RepID=A0A0F9B018_9ZZZZ
MLKQGDRAVVLHYIGDNLIHGIFIRNTTARGILFWPDGHELVELSHLDITIQKEWRHHVARVDRN